VSLIVAIHGRYCPNCPVEVIEGDLVDPAAQARALKGVSTVFNLAGSIYDIAAMSAVNVDAVRLMLDIAGHRAQRRAVVVRIAQSAIDEVRATGNPKALDAMSAFERKIVHDEVAAAGLAFAVVELRHGRRS